MEKSNSDSGGEDNRLKPKSCTEDKYWDLPRSTKYRWIKKLSKKKDGQNHGELPNILGNYELGTTSNQPSSSAFSIQHEIPDALDEEKNTEKQNDPVFSESDDSIFSDSPKKIEKENCSFDDETFLSRKDDAPEKIQFIFMLLGLQVKHKLTKVAVADICKFVNLIKNEQFLPPSYHLFETSIKKYKTEVEFHNMCPKCNKYIGKTKQQQLECFCGHDILIQENINEGNFFLYLSVKSQLRCMLENYELRSKMNYMDTRKKNISSNIEDIYDGQVFKSQLRRFSETVPGDSIVVSLNFNTDGVPVFSSSKCGIWPILCVVNNLHPALRKKHVILSSLWFGEKKPVMNEFFKPFVTELNLLAQNGFDYSTEIGTTNKCFVLPMVAICDSVARPVLQNIIQFNGEYGCSFCLHPGETVVRGRGISRVYPLAACEKRTHIEWIQMATTASENNAVVKGVKGPSILFSLVFFNMVSSFVPDYMHSVLLGVVRQFFRLWFDSTNHLMPYYIGNRSHEVDAKLLSIQPPYVLSRTPRTLGTNKYWKAHEWYNWLFYYSLIVLKGILPVKFLFHWVFLVKSVHTLLKESVSKSDVSMAHSSLEAFVKMTETLYGKEHVTFNVHQCIHLADSVMDWGPMWAHSGFIFENFNGVLLQMVKSSNGVPQQIASSFLNLQIVNINNSITTDVSSNFMFLPKILPRNNVLQSSEKVLLIDGVTLLGNTCKTFIKDAFRLAIASCTNLELEHRAVVHCYERIIVNNIVFHSSSYKKVKKRNSYTAILKNGAYFEIELFILVKGICFAVGYYLQKLNKQLVSNLPPNVLLNHIQPVKRDTCLISAVKAQDLKSLVVFIYKRDLFSNNYVCLPPNSHENSM